jgi:hypothetical protein
MTQLEEILTAQLSRALDRIDELEFIAYCVRDMVWKTSDEKEANITGPDCIWFSMYQDGHVLFSGDEEPTHVDHNGSEFVHSVCLQNGCSLAGLIAGLLSCSDSIGFWVPDEWEPEKVRPFLGLPEVDRIEFIELLTLSLPADERKTMEDIIEEFLV